MTKELIWNAIEQWRSAHIAHGQRTIAEKRAAVDAALEAAQAEIARLTKDNATLLSDVGGLRASVGSMRNDLGFVEDARNAALARIAELEKQEPVGYVHPGQLAEIHEGYAYVYPKQAQGASQPLFAAAGASPQTSQARELSDAEIDSYVNSFLRVAGVSPLSYTPYPKQRSEMRDAFRAAINAKGDA